MCVSCLATSPPVGGRPGRRNSNGGSQQTNMFRSQEEAPPANLTTRPEVVRRPLIAYPGAPSLFARAAEVEVLILLLQSPLSTQTSGLQLALSEGHGKPFILPSKILQKGRKRGDYSYTLPNSYLRPVPTEPMCPRPSCLTGVVGLSQPSVGREGPNRVH